MEPVLQFFFFCLCLVTPFFLYKHHLHACICFLMPSIIHYYHLCIRISPTSQSSFLACDYSSINIDRTRTGWCEDPCCLKHEAFCWGSIHYAKFVYCSCVCCIFYVPSTSHLFSLVIIASCGGQLQTLALVAYFHWLKHDFISLALFPDVDLNAW